MIRHFLIVPAVVCASFSAALKATAQAPKPAPPVPPLTPQQKEAAAAIEAPKTLAPPPAPGQLQGGKPASPPVPATPPPPGSSASKMQALEAVTRQPETQAAPRVTAPADKLPVTSSTSASRQFIVHGKVFETRSAMSSRCDEISRELRKVLNDKEPFTLPIVVVLNTGEDAEKSKGPPIATAISELTHGGFHLQVTVNERPGLKAEDLRKEVVRALLAERILRNHQKITTPQGRLLLPDWVMTGVIHAMDYRASTRPSTLFATIFRSGKIYGIEEIINASPVEMDGLSRNIYETSCGALVLALVDQPDGPARFNKFLSLLASDPRSERDLLNVAFPTFAASASSLNKWWSLQLATLSKPGIDEPYSPTDSLKALEDAITIRYEASAADAPKNVRPRPFVVPAPLPVVAARDTTAEKTDEGTASKPKAKTIAASEEEPGAAEEKPRRSLWRRLLFLGDPADEKTETAANTAEEDKPGFFSRLFSFGSDEKTAGEAAKPATKEKPKKEAVAGPETGEEEKKPSLLNPLNWFRGAKEEEKPSDKALRDKKGGQASLLEVDPPAIARLISPALADAWQALAPSGPRMTAQPLFDFRKRKSRPEDEKKQDAEKPKEATSGKPAVKKDDPPRTTNPNARPASKKSATTPGTPKVTNPNARPVPAGMSPAAAGTATTAGAANPALLSVVLPLEEYQHILKRPDRAKILEPNITALRALELRVSVLFRPVINAYLAAVIDLQEGKTKDMDKRLATLREFALVAHQKSVAVRDYLDWFEASESGRLSGKFEDFLNLQKTIENELPPRTDPISKYLDAIDKEFSR